MYGGDEQRGGDLAGLGEGGAEGDAWEGCGVVA